MLRTWWTIGLLILFATSHARADFSYDANARFALNEAGAETNPFGPFMAGYSTSLGGLTAFTTLQHTNDWYGSSNLEGWSTNDLFTVPAAVINTSAAPITTSFGITIDPLQIMLHGGGANENGILRFIAPASGSYTIEGDWESLHFGITRKYVLHNGTPLFDSLSSVVSFNLSTTLAAGDTIDFAVNDYDGYSGDSTGLRALIVSVPEPSAAAMAGIGLVVVMLLHRFRNLTFLN